MGLVDLFTVVTKEGLTGAVGLVTEKRKVDGPGYKDKDSKVSDPSTSWTLLITN